MIPSDFDSDAMTDPWDWDALARYVSGESTPDEARALQHWLDARPERARLVAALRQSIDGLASDTAPDIDVDVEGALRKVHARMAEPIDATPVMPLPARRALPRFAARTASSPTAGRWRVIVPLAAAAAIVITAIGIRQSRRSSGHAAAETIAARSYTTGVGQRDSVRLADGSRVVLGPSSRLDVATGFGAPRRDVTLRGEAYFDVVHDAARPFTVHSAGAQIVDVGTKFTVRDDSGGTVRVAVAAGSVRLSEGAMPDSGIILAAGDAATVGTAGAATRSRGALAESDTAFTHGRLVFRDAPLGEVAAELRRWYGIELRTSGSALARRRLTATFAGESTEQVMAIIGGALGARVERRGDTVIVR